MRGVLMVALVLSALTRSARATPDETAVSLFDEGEFLLCWGGQTQAVERILLVALQTAEAARLKPWWLPPFDEFVPNAKTEQQRRDLVEAVLNEMVPRYVVARYPARLGRYDHDFGGFPIVLRVRTADWQLESPQTANDRRPVYSYSMLRGLDPFELERIQRGLPADWGSWNHLTASALIRVVARCTPDEGRRIRAREHEARIEFVLATPAEPPDWRTVPERPGLVREFHVRRKVYPVAEASLELPGDARFSLFKVRREQLQPLAIPPYPSPGAHATPEEIARFVDAEAEGRWQDLQSRCPACRGEKRCGACDGRGYVLRLCDRCNGSGQIEIKCYLCRGTGRLGERSCYACWAGRRLLFCPICDDPVHGSGKVREPCSKCGRTGRCPTCKGTGRVPLP